jgi:hypothetical protein
MKSEEGLPLFDLQATTSNRSTLPLARERERIEIDALKANPTDQARE